MKEEKEGLRERGSDEYGGARSTHGKKYGFYSYGSLGSLDQGLRLALKMSKALIDGDGSGERHARQRNGISKGAEVRQL